jgi:hypothetical protein
LKNTHDVDPQITWSWDVLGLPESEVASRAESALHNEQFEKAYRVHLPYVEFKLSFLRSQIAEATKIERQLDVAFQDVFCLRNSTDLAELLAQKILSANYHVVVRDLASKGYLFHRLSKPWKKLFAENRIDFVSSQSEPISEKPKQAHDFKTLVLKLEDQTGRKAKASLHGPMTRSLDIDSIYTSRLLIEREHQYFAERALHFWYTQI